METEINKPIHIAVKICDFNAVNHSGEQSGLSEPEICTQSLS